MRYHSHPFEIIHTRRNLPTGLLSLVFVCASDGVVAGVTNPYPTLTSPHVPPLVRKMGERLCDKLGAKADTGEVVIGKDIFGERVEEDHPGLTPCLISCGRPTQLSRTLYDE